MTVKEYIEEYLKEKHREVIAHPLSETINPRKTVKHLKASILRYKGMTIDSKLADELSRHIAAIIPELERVSR